MLWGGMIERALLLCPATVTGGPHAIHQLSLALNQRGLPTQIAYYAHDPCSPR
ncbi:MAG: hypothetical protein KY446_09630 [Proteobacteria bacterium]|nr:hypothetical protein [Pseudomonadota bacterium]